MELSKEVQIATGVDVGLRVGSQNNASLIEFGQDRLQPRVLSLGRLGLRRKGTIAGDCGWVGGKPNVSNTI